MSQGYSCQTAVVMPDPSTVMFQGIIKFWASAQALCSWWWNEMGSLSILCGPLLLAATWPVAFLCNPRTMCTSCCSCYVVWEPLPIWSQLAQMLCHPNASLKYGVICNHACQRWVGGSCADTTVRHLTEDRGRTSLKGRWGGLEMRWAEGVK